MNMDYAKICSLWSSTNLLLNLWWKQMKNKALFLIIPVTIILASCIPVSIPEITQTPLPMEPTEAFPEIKIDIQTLDKETENELITFMLNFSLQALSVETTNYLQTNGKPWVNAPPSANLIIYLPPNKQKFEAPWDAINYEEPVKVWWYFDGNLVEATDNQTAIQKWQELYAHNSWPDRFDFGILSLSSDKTTATIYFSRSTCPECSGGILLTVQKNASGKWTLTNSKLLWLG